MRGQLVAFLTATRVEWHEAQPFEDADYSEEHGWIDLRWSRTDLHESRNDVRPLYSEPCNYVRVAGGVELERPVSDQTIEEVRDVFDDLPSGPYWDNGDGTYYGQGEHLDSDGSSWTYAVHWHVKHRDERGQWVETSVDVSEFAQVLA